MSGKKVAELLIQIREVGSEILDRLVITIDDVISVVAKLPKFFADSFSAFREQEQAVNTLNQAMINQGIYSAELQRKYLDLSGALQKTTGFTDDQINSAQALLQSHIGSREVSESLLKATLNLATVKKMDLSSASELVGKAISSENDVLARHGIRIDEAASRTDRLSAVVAALDSKFHGQAEAATKNTGKVQQMSKSFGELMEVIGERMAPMVVRLSSDFARMFDKISGFLGTNTLAKKSVSELTDELFKQQKALDAFMAKPLTKLQMEHRMNIPEIDVLKARIAEIKTARDQAFADDLQSMRNNYDNSQALATTKHEEKMVADLTNALAVQDQAIAMQGAKEEQQFSLQAQWEMKKADSAKSHEDKVAALKRAAALKQQQADAQIADQAIAKKKKDDEQRISDQRSTFATISTLAQSSNQTLAAIGKAAAITQIAIDTPIAIGRALAAFPPPFNFAAAGLVGAAMAAQAARVAGVPLAEGGIVRARPGGIQATIGEGGQDEMVVPLDRAREFGLGGGGGNNITIVVNGGLLGSEAEAHEFAVAVDRELLRLRQNNASVAFDSGVV